MRGSPLIRLGLVLAALLLLLVPLRHLTSREAPPAPVAVPEEQTVPTRIVLTSTSVPFQFQITHLGRTVWEGESEVAEVTREIGMEFPAEGIDLLVEAQWPRATPAALKIDVAPSGRAASSATLWGTKSGSDVFTFR